MNYKSITVILLTFSMSINAFSQTKFKVCNVKLADKALKEQSYKSVVASMTNSTKTERKLEDFGEKNHTLVKAGAHPFAFAVQAAYGQHRPLVISPDMVWLMIMQGFSQHILANSEDLRNKFVKFKGKKTLIVTVDGNNFVKGSSENNWEGIFPQFVKQIEAYTGNSATSLASQKFTTTTTIEQAAFEITFMETMSKYFEYAARASCGIPEITLEGTTKDWQQILDKTQELKKYKMDWWIKKLEPILQEFVQASKGKVNKSFWKKIYKKKAFRRVVLWKLVFQVGS